MIAVGIFLLALGAYTVFLVMVLRRYERVLEARWIGRLQKCDEIIAGAEKAEQRTHEALVQMNTQEARVQDHLLAMERVMTDPRVHQALR